MNMRWLPEEASVAPEDQGAQMFDIRMRVSVVDAQLLWQMAARALASAGGFSDEEIEDTLGPREDPLLSECLTLLMGPRQGSGCQFQNFRIAETGG